MAEAGREDRDRQQDADEENQRPEALAEEVGHKYDSAKRCQELASSFEGLSEGEAVHARLSADQDEPTLPHRRRHQTPMAELEGP
jgi:hypothetical protein